MKIYILMLVEPGAEGQPTGVIFQEGQFSQGASLPLAGSTHRAGK